MGLIQGRYRSSRMIVLAKTTQINSSATSRLIVMTVRFSLEEAGPSNSKGSRRQRDWVSGINGTDMGIFP
jgi:hypothetical protein